MAFASVIGNDHSDQQRIQTGSNRHPSTCTRYGPTPCNSFLDDDKAHTTASHVMTAHQTCLTDPSAAPEMSFHPRMSLGQVFVKCMELALTIPGKCKSDAVYSRVVSFLHRMVELLGEVTLPYLQPAFEVSP